MPNGVGPNPSDPEIAVSDAFYARATGLIPAATQTLAKGPDQFVKGVAPKYLKRGRGSHVWDVDGNEYIDWVSGIGAIILGYADPEVDRAGWFTVDEAKKKINPAQAALVDELVSKLAS